MLASGLEHFLNTNLALNVALQYRFIRYDEFQIDEMLYSLRPRESGDTFPLRSV